jgi:hypothetical protein
MEWFPLWLPLVSQLMVPVSLLAWLAFGRHATKARSIVVAALVATYVVALGDSPSPTAPWARGPSHVGYAVVITGHNDIAPSGAW